jgi:hypothetical protein
VIYLQTIGAREDLNGHWLIAASNEIHSQIDQTSCFEWENGYFQRRSQFSKRCDIDLLILRDWQDISHPDH